MSSGAEFSDVLARKATRRGRTASEEGTGGRGNTLGSGGGRGGQSAPKVCIAKEVGFFERLKQRLRSKDAFADLLKVMGMFSDNIITKNEMEKLSRRSKYYTTPISDLDLNKEQHCSTSYRHLPEDYPKLQARGRTSLQAGVLNDHWVS
eukprot:scaffold13996_cov39-Prasinocladus_malaysianus.AAC.1